MSYSGQELFEAGLRDSTNKEKDEIERKYCSIVLQIQCCCSESSVITVNYYFTK